jgi:hypothetical protein
MCRCRLRTVAAVIVLSGVMYAFGRAEQLHAQKDHCDPALSQTAGYHWGYQLRGDRCEGIYIQDVSGTTLMVASLTESFEDYDLDSGKELLVQWAAPGDGAPHLRAQGTRPRLYYRMDTARPPGSTEYSWPLDVLRAQGIPRQDIGVVGWTRCPVGGTERRVYLPLRIGQQSSPLRSDSYQLVLLPGRELTEVFVSLAPIGVDGEPASFLADGKALEYGYYPADRPIAIPIRTLQEPGVYYLEVGATLEDGGSATVELWFYHPNR